MNSQHTKAHTLPSRTSRHTSQNLAKSVLYPTQEEIQFSFSLPSIKIKTPDTQADTATTSKHSNDNGGTERQLVTAVWRNGGFSASYYSFVGLQTLFLRINICGVNPPLRQAAKRYSQCLKDRKL